MARGKKLTTEEFIEEAIAVHGEKYGYSKIKYIGANKKVIIICKIHGEFEQRASHHLEGHGCKKCAIKNSSSKIEEFVKKATKAHGDKFNYSEAEYTNAKTKIKIYCKKCKEYFLQTPDDHLNKRGCKKCSVKKRSSNIDVFVKKAIKRHGNKFNYSDVEYINSYIKIKIYCKKCKEYFWQTPNGHLSGKGCSKCKVWRGELRIEKYLLKNNIKYQQQKTFKGCRYKIHLRFDFYLSGYSACIEFNGKQHYESVKYFGGDSKLKEQQKKDEIKTRYCEDNGIKLICIPYTEFDNIEEILEKELF